MFESTCCSYGVEVSHDNVVTTGVQERLKCEHRNGNTGEDRGDVDDVHVDEDMVDDGCYGEMFGGLQDNFAQGQFTRGQFAQKFECFFFKY